MINEEVKSHLLPPIFQGVNASICTGSNSVKLSTSIWYLLFVILRYVAEELAGLPEQDILLTELLL